MVRAMKSAPGKKLKKGASLRSGTKQIKILSAIHAELACLAADNARNIGREAELAIRAHIMRCHAGHAPAD